MTKVAIWCRHDGDNIIGVGADIPWCVPSDSKRFRNITKEQTLVVGKKTYESFPNRTLPNRKFLVVTRQTDYEVSDTSASASRTAWTSSPVPLSPAARISWT